jgi:hypothetical protein
LIFNSTTPVDIRKPNQLVGLSYVYGSSAIDKEAFNR